MRYFILLLSCFVIVGCDKSDRKGTNDDKEQSVGEPEKLAAHNESDHAHRFIMNIPENFNVKPLVSQHVRWRDSLITNLGHQGSNYVYLLTDIPITADGSREDHAVYQNVTAPEQFLIVPHNGHKVIIDTEQSIIGTMGVAGITMHRFPGGDMYVCLIPTGISSNLGVPLSDSEKTGVATPMFVDQAVRWTWPKLPLDEN